jgi:alkylation response protein AidB-like acyl-CoA dehydrogenase
MSQHEPLGASENVASRFSPVIELLSANAELVDRSPTIPAENLTALATAGLYGALAPVDLGGLGLELDEACALVEQLAAACLTTTFVWLQHFRLLGTLLDPSLPEGLGSLLPAVLRGDVKGGVSLGGLLPGPARLNAEECDEGWRLTGEAPWISGWGIVDELLITARNADGNVASFVMDAHELEGLSATPVHLSAMNASSTVTLKFSHVALSRERYVGSQPYAPGHERREGLRVNGSLALGLARRCCDLIGPSPLDDELVRARRELDRSDAEQILPARAQAAELAVRAAHVLAVSKGSRSAISGDIAERSTREASLLLVFASRPAIKEALLDQMMRGV